MSQFPKNSSRKDDGYETSMTSLGENLWGVRVLYNGKVIQEDTASSRKEARDKLKELLRWVDKLGGRSQMASASRVRQKKT